MRRNISSLSLAIALASSATSASIAEAQGGPRVVVQRFTGVRASTVQRRLIESLEENGLHVVSEEEVRRTRQELGHGRRIEGGQYVELARRLNVVAFIDGRVTRRRRRWSLRVRVRNAEDGEVLGDGRWAGRSASALAAIRRNGFARLSDSLARARAPSSSSSTSSTSSTSSSSSSTGEAEPWWRRGDEEPLDIEEELEAAPRDTANRYDALRIMLLGGTLLRSMSTTVGVYASQRGGSPGNPESAFLEEVRRYQSGGIGHFELGGRFEVYPGSFDAAQSFPYLGVVLELTHSVGVKSNGFDRLTAAPVAVPTNQLEAYAGLRFRYRFGPARREPELHIDAGWGTFNFNLGVEELRQIELDTIIPPMQHGYFQAAIGLEYGVVPTYLTLGIEVGGRVGTNIGGDTRDVWGTQTAPSNGLLLGASLRIEVPEIVEGAFIGLNVRYFLFATDFQGQVGCAVVEDCGAFISPWEDDRLWEVWPVEAPGGSNPGAIVGGPPSPVIDNYLRLQLAIGYAFY